MKKYTLEEAYQEILRIKKDSGLLDFHQKQENQAYLRGYTDALNDLLKESQKRADILLLMVKIKT